MPVVITKGKVYFNYKGLTYALNARPTDPAVLRTLPLVGERQLASIQRSAPPIPPAFSLRAQMTPVENQHRRGTCVAFATNAALEFSRQRDLSEQYTYWLGEKYDGNSTEGLPLTGTLKVVAKYGTVDELYWGYHPDPIPGDIGQGPPPPAAVNAPKIKFKAVKRVDRSLGAKKFRILIHAYKKPLLAVVPVINNCGWETGRIVMPKATDHAEWERRQSDRSTTGGKDWHAIPLVGYDDTRKHFIFKNGWGLGWGDLGYGTIHYKYIDKYCPEACVAW